MVQRVVKKSGSPTSRHGSEKDRAQAARLRIEGRKPRDLSIENQVRRMTVEYDEHPRRVVVGDAVVDVPKRLPRVDVDFDAIFLAALDRNKSVAK